MGDAYGPIDATYKQMYADNVQLQVQLKTNPFESMFELIPNMRGREMQAVELVGKSEALIDQADSSPTPNIPPKHEGIYVVPRRITWGRTIPKSTEIKAAVDYTSVYVREASAAVARARAAIIRDAVLGPRLMRQDNTGAIASVAFDTANRTVAVNYQGPGVATANGDISVPKIVKGLEKLGFSDLDLDVEDVFMMLTMKQNTALYNQLQVVNKFYVDRAQFEEKTVKTFMGVKIKIYNYLNVDGSGYRQIPMWMRSGVHVGDADPLQTFLERNPSMQYQPHAFLENWMGATRSEDEKVVSILCDETNT